MGLHEVITLQLGSWTAQNAFAFAIGLLIIGAFVVFVSWHVAVWIYNIVKDYYLGLALM